MCVWGGGGGAVEEEVGGGGALWSSAVRSPHESRRLPQEANAASCDGAACSSVGICGNLL